MSDEDRVYQAFLLPPADPMMADLRIPNEALRFAKRFLAAVREHGWSPALALHKLSQTGFARVEFGFDGCGAYNPGLRALRAAQRTSHRIRAYDWILDPLNNRDPYSELWQDVLALLRAHVNEGRIENEWAIRYHLCPYELGQWMIGCEICCFMSYAKLLKGDQYTDEETKDLGMWIIENHNYELNLTFSIIRSKPALFIRGNEDAVPGNGE